VGKKVSYQEFLSAFRTKTYEKAAELQQAVNYSLHGQKESFGPEPSEELLDEEANIPGGKYDPETIKQESD
jgi:hypothetical protein